MTEQQMQDLTVLQKTLLAEFQKAVKIVQGEEFKQLDALNRDLTLTYANALQTLIGVCSMLIGLNYRSPAQKDEPDSGKTDADGKEPD